MMQAEKWQKDLAVYRNINTTFIIEGNVHDLQPFLYEDDGSCEPVSLSLYLHRYLSAVGYDPVVFYNRIDGFSNPYALDMTASFFRTTGTHVPSVLLTGYPAPEALSSAKNPPAAGKTLRRTVFFTFCEEAAGTPADDGACFACPSAWSAPAAV